MYKSVMKLAVILIVFSMQLLVSESRPKRYHHSHSKEDVIRRITWQQAPRQDEVLSTETLDCEKMIENALSRQLIDDTKPIYIDDVLDFKAKFTTCQAKKECLDAKTPESHKWICESKELDAKVLLFDDRKQAKNYYNYSVVGNCHCRLEYKGSDFFVEENFNLDE